MKKTFLTLLFLLILILAACTPQIVKSGGMVEHGTPLPSADIKAAYKDSSVVYVTESGTKYHSENCPHLSESKIPMSLNQAEKQGYEPCSVCDPPS